jgi:hypothetical protein
MMRRCELFLALTIIAGACTSGDSSPSSTTLVSNEVTAPVDDHVAADLAWTEIVVDSEGVTGQRPRVLVSDTGDVSVVYQREVADNEYEIRWVVCEDPTCDQVSVTSLTEPSARVLWGAASLLPDGSPIFMSIRPGPAPNPPMVVASCADPECSSTVETEIAGAAPLGLAVSPNGYPVLAYGVWNDETTSRNLHFGLCDDASCSTHDPVPFGTVNGTGSGSLQFLADGSPVLFFVEDLYLPSAKPYVAVCSDPSCTEVTRSETTDSTTVELVAGLPQMAWVSNFEVVRLVGCLDARCSTTADVEVYRGSNGIEFHVAEALTGDQATPCIAASMREYSTLEAIWIICGDPSCESVSTQVLGEISGSLPSVASLPDGGVVVAARTGQWDLCLHDELGELKCADPKATDLSALTLQMCHGPACTTPTNIEPNP